MTGMVAGQIPIAASATSVTSSTATLAASFMPAHTGDVTSPAGSTVNTLATVNSNVGTFQGLTVNGKGLVTAAASQTGHLPGTATNDAAAAGEVGQVISTVVTVGVTIPSATTVNVGSISLTPGDWDVMGEVWVSGTGGTSTYMQAGISTTSAFLAGGGPAMNTSFIQVSVAGVISICPLRLSLGVTTPVYLCAAQGGLTGANATGKIWARRAR
jgi:hypothetical protein